MDSLRQQSPHLAVLDGGAKALDHILVQWFHTDGIPRLIVDADLSVHWVNLSARELMARDNPLLIHNGKVRPRNSRSLRALREFVANASPNISTFCVRGHESDDYFIIFATSLRLNSKDYIGLIIRSVSSKLACMIPDLEDAFGFTKTESRVVCQLLRGHTAEETARRMSVSLETTRTHIKRTYAKMGVSSREAFFYRLMPFVVFIP